jgi:hypothetical protein
MTTKVKPGIYIPEGGWVERCYYLVHISYSRQNPIHKAILFTGFLNGRGVRGGPDKSPGGYAQIFRPGYENPRNYSEGEIYYLEVVKQITFPGDLKSDHFLEWED